MLDLFSEKARRKAKMIIAFSCIVLLIVQKSSGQVEDGRTESIRVLRNAVATGGTFFIKVHAAENLIFQNCTESLDTTFFRLQTFSPDNYIGAARVLAQLFKHQPEKYRTYIYQLLNAFELADNRTVSLTALESLGKLGYSKPSPEIERFADTGTMGFKGMARWVLSNDKTTATEKRLSELLLSNEIINYRYAAYAFRFKDKVSNQTVSRLRLCLSKLATNNVARVYVASSLFVHAAGSEKQNVKAILLSYLAGDAGQRYEVAEALGISGDKSDIPTLKKLMSDENMDVSVAAANALLKRVPCSR